MKTNRSLVNVAAHTLAVAVMAVMMSMVFTACSGKNDPPTPDLPVNTVIIDGEKIPVQSVKYEKKYNDRFTLFLFFTKNSKEDCVRIDGYTAKHLNKDIDLTKIDGTTPWQVICFVRGKKLFDAYSMPPSSQGLVFDSGKLRIDGNPDGGEFTIRLTNGKITDADYGDGKEHIISIDWKGEPNF